MIARGAGCGKAACPVLRGAGYNSGHGRDHVAPPGPFCVEQNRTHAVRPQGARQGWCASNQAENREHKLRPTARGVPRLLETPFTRDLLAEGHRVTVIGECRDRRRGVVTRGPVRAYVPVHGS